MTGRDNRLWIALEAVGIRQVLARSEAAAVYMADGYARLKGTPDVRVRPVRAGGRQCRRRSRRAVLGGQSGRRPGVGDAPFGSLPPRVPGARAAAAVRLGHEMGRRSVRRDATFRGSFARPPGTRSPGRLAPSTSASRTTSSRRTCRATPVRRRSTRSSRSRTADRRRAAADAEAVVRVLASASRPIILAGGGIHQSGAHEALRQFAERLSHPGRDEQLAARAASPRRTTSPSAASAATRATTRMRRCATRT